MAHLCLVLAEWNVSVQGDGAMAEEQGTHKQVVCFREVVAISTANSVLDLEGNGLLKSLAGYVS